VIRDNETICALATPTGEGGIGIIKVSGSQAFKVLKKIFRQPDNKFPDKFQPWRLYYGFIINPISHNKIDEVLVSYMKKPKTYTREDIVEINSHSGPFIVEQILKLTLKLGARLAEPGEFTRRAFLNGRVNLLEAEAVCDLVKANSEASLRRAQSQLCGELSIQIEKLKEKLINFLAGLEVNIDFINQDTPQIRKEDLKEGLLKIKRRIKKLLQGARFSRIYKEGVGITLAGAPNVGKSSLFNALLKEERAIVTEIPGTTRDSIEETITFKGIAVRLMDTAGLTKTEKKINKEAIKRSKRAIQEADLILLVFDASRKNNLEWFFKTIKKDLKKQIDSKPIIFVANKIDLLNKKEKEQVLKRFRKKKPVLVSAKTGQGAKVLEDKIKELVFRHKNLLEGAQAYIERALKAVNRGLSDEIIIIDLKDATTCLLEITGEDFFNKPNQVLDKIFANFCIGK